MYCELIDAENPLIGTLLGYYSKPMSRGFSIVPYLSDNVSFKGFFHFRPQLHN